jgi:hypothetical protein
MEKTTKRPFQQALYPPPPSIALGKNSSPLAKYIECFLLAIPSRLPSPLPSRASGSLPAPTRRGRRGSFPPRGPRRQASRGRGGRAPPWSSRSRQPRCVQQPPPLDPVNGPLGGGVGRAGGGAGEDHVWFEDRWMVASLCDE